MMLYSVLQTVKNACLKNHWLNHSQRKYFLRLMKVFLLSHFRKRCYTYELATGTALIYETIIGLSGEMAKIMKIN